MFMPKSAEFIISCIFILLLNCYSSAAQNNNTDKTPFPSDSIANDSTRTDSIKAPKKKASITSEVKYSAKDSIIFSLDGEKVYLYQDAVVKYEDIELTAWFIELDLKRNEAYACGTKDSLNKEIGLPVYKDKKGEYTMRTMKYNFETKKAIIEHVVTEQGEGFIVSDIAKKSAKNEFCLKGGMYTTCDNHDHPHFGLQMTKAKVIPGKKIVTGPAYLIFEDVPFYFIGLPFAFVPSTSKYSSGFLMPSYGEESERGFFLKNGGYYFAINDYFDFQVTGDIYTNGSWGLHSGSTYRNKYKFGGNFKLDYITNVTSEKDLPDYAQSRDFSIMWSHRQDTKANPYSTFSASVNYSSSAYDRRNVNSVIDPQTLATSTKSSSITFSKKWPSSPFNFSANLNGSQNTRDTTVTFNIPELTFTMSRLYPFKSKNKVGSDETWYEKISLSYTGNLKNSIQNYKEYNLSKANFSTDWQNGIKHTIPISMNLKFLKYFTSSPTFNYTERWYFKAIYKTYDKHKKAVVNADTTTGFYRVFDYNYSIGTQTKLYTFFEPNSKVFGDKIKTIRHVMTPSVSMGFTPDFSQSKYGYYENLEYYDYNTEEKVKTKYSKYATGIYGSPGSSKSGSMSFQLGNMLDMKVKSLEDSTGFKKVTILESLSMSSSYNFLADSMNWSNVSMTGRTKVFKTDLSFGATFDPYGMALNASNTPVRVNEYNFHLTSANLGFGFQLNNDSFKKKDDKDKSEQSDNQEDESQEMSDETEPERKNQSGSSNENLEMGDDGYAKFKIPWSFNIDLNSYVVQGSNFNTSKNLYNKKVTATVNFSGSLSPTPKWSISFSSGFDLQEGGLTHTNFNIRRNLHCWSMSMNLVPIGPYKSYYFVISANSSMLKDLKYEKRNAANYSY